MISEDMTAVIFSLESTDGSSPSSSPAGATRKSGPAPVPASRSASRDGGTVQMTLDISGPLGLGSSASVDLSSCLASRLRERLGTDGSMEYSQIWKHRTTPAGRSYWEHTASRRRTSDSGFGGWPTPNAMPENRGGLQTNPEAALKRRKNGHQLNLDDAATLTRGKPLSRQTATTGGRGALAPEFVRWLMGYPVAWESFADSAMPSCRP